MAAAASPRNECVKKNVSPTNEQKETYNFFKPDMPLEYCLQLLAKIEFEVTKFDNCAGLWNFVLKFQSEANRAIAIYLQTPEGKKTYETHHALLDLTYTIHGVCNALVLPDIRKEILRVWMTMNFEDINTSYNNYIQQVKMHEKATQLDEFMSAVREAICAGISLEEIEKHILLVHKTFFGVENIPVTQSEKHINTHVVSSTSAAKVDNYVISWNTNGLAMETFKDGIEHVAKQDGLTTRYIDSSQLDELITIGYIPLTSNTTTREVVWKMYNMLPKSKQGQIQFWSWNYGGYGVEIPNGIKLLFPKGL